MGEAPAQTNLPPVNASGGSSKQSYIDSLSLQTQSELPSDFASYAIEVLNREGRGAGISNQVRVPLAVTLPPPKDFQAKVTSQGVVLSWIKELPSRSPGTSFPYIVRIYRKQVDNPQPNIVGEVPLGTDQSLTDSNIEWEKTYEYHATVVTKIDQANNGAADNDAAEIEGDDTPGVKVFVDDVFPPSVPGALQAVFSGPGQVAFVDLIWAPNMDADLSGYNVYRREGGESPMKVNAELVKNPAYRDSSVQAGKTYVYSVSAVDIRGNESARSEEATESVPQ